MSDVKTCPSCGAALPADAPAGLCPKCVLLGGLEHTTAGFTAEAGGSRWTPPGAAELGAYFPALEIFELLGRGGMGAVYKVRQKSLDRVAALKILPPHFAGAPAFAERFAREAKALARLNHPNIVTLYEFGTAEAVGSPGAPPVYFFLMEFVDGTTLRQLVDGSRLAPREALAIVPQVCDALQYAHDSGIIHRDIKPENILLDRRGRVKVADFGLAKLAGPAGSGGAGLSSEGAVVSPELTDAARILGTPAYIAPEQAASPESVDHRADIYALGVVFYQMLTGDLPPSPLTPPSKKVVIDVRLDEVVLRALEREPGRRYQHVSDVKTEVETILRTPTPASATSAAAAPPRSKSLPGAVIASMILHGIALACVVIFLVTAPRQFANIAKDFKIALPLSTEIVLLLSQFLRNWYFLAAPLILMLLAADGAVCWLLHRFKPKLHLAWSLLVLLGLGGSLLLGVWSIARPLVLTINSIATDSPAHELVNAHIERESLNSSSLSALVCFGIFALLVVLAVVGFFLTRNRRRLAAGSAPVDPPPAQPAVRPPAPSLAPWRTLGLVYFCYLGLLVITADSLPARVASHFGFEGQADGWMSRGGYLAFVGVFPLGLTLLFGGVAAIIHRLPPKFINVPQREYWLSPQHRAELSGLLNRFFVGLASLMTVFFGVLHFLTVQANFRQPATLLMGPVLLIVIGFLLVVIVWLIQLMMRLGDPGKIRVAAPPVKPWWKTWWFQAVVAVIVCVLLKIFFIEAFVISSRALEPELPLGSRVLVWKFGHSYRPGDILAYRDGDQIKVGRFLRASAGGGERLSVSRNGLTDETFDRAKALGAVISVYWRGTPPLVHSSNASAALQALVENIYRQGFKDLRDRRTISWSKPMRLEDGNWVIRYCFQAHTDGSPEATVREVRFTFTSEGHHVEMRPIFPLSYVPGIKVPAVGAGAIDWVKLAGDARYLGGTVVAIDGRLALKMMQESDGPTDAAIVLIDNPRLKSLRYELVGEVKYDVNSDGYLEMWSNFNREGDSNGDMPVERYFSRTVAPAGSGPLAKLSGKSDWRPFTLPFDATNVGTSPFRIEFNLHLASGGAVYLANVRLQETKEPSLQTKPAGTVPAATTFPPPYYYPGVKHRDVSTGPIQWGSDMEKPLAGDDAYVGMLGRPKIAGRAVIVCQIAGGSTILVGGNLSSPTWQRAKVLEVMEGSCSDKVISIEGGSLDGWGSFPDNTKLICIVVPGAPAKLGAKVGDPPAWYGLVALADTPGGRKMLDGLRKSEAEAAAATAPAMARVRPVVHLRCGVSGVGTEEVDRLVAAVLMREFSRVLEVQRVTTLLKAGQADIYLVADAGVDRDVYLAAVAAAIKTAAAKLPAETNMGNPEWLKPEELIPPSETAMAPEFRVKIDREKLDALGISLSDVTETIRKNATRPATTQAASELLKMPLSADGRVVPLKDVATVTVEDSPVLIRRDQGIGASLPTSGPVGGAATRKSF